MRNLCILFIAMTSKGSSVNWLMEVQGILDQNRCPIVQIIEDDKGVHIVAAVNLYESIPEASMLGIKCCEDLIRQEVGCSVGMAQGKTFCGVTGSNLIACRWDITGPYAVRAARLMQYAVRHDSINIAIDGSIYAEPMAAARLRLLERSVALKGSPDIIPIYTLSNAKKNCAFRIQSTMMGRCHEDLLNQIHAFISAGLERCAVVVKGPPLSGKKSTCQHAAGLANFVPYLHLSDKTSGLLQLARTIATWFTYVDFDDIKAQAQCVLQHCEGGRWSRAHDLCIEMVDNALMKGISSCFLVDRVQFLDDFSLSLIRGCIRRQEDLSLLKNSVRGRICFLCVHCSLYKWRSAEHIVDNITRSGKNIKVPIVHIGEANDDSLRLLFRDLSDMEVEERWLRTYASSAGYCSGYFMIRANALRNLSGKLWKESKPGYAETTENLDLHVPSGYIRKNKDVRVMQISPEVAMRFAQLYDELPPLFATMCKVLAMATTRNGFYKMEKNLLWEVCADLVTEGVEREVMTAAIEEMESMSLIKVEKNDQGEFVSFQNPALGDIAMDVCTPIQVSCILRALIERLEPIKAEDFKIPLVLADLHHQLGHNEEVLMNLWRAGYQSFLSSSKSMQEAELNLWIETIQEEIQTHGYHSSVVLGNLFSMPSVSRKVVGTGLPLVKIYSAPVAFGPMGHTLSVITRNTFHEFRNFHGAEEKDATDLCSATSNAAKRYLQELSIVEGFLSENKCGATSEHLESERKMITAMSTPCSSDKEVIEKAEMILKEYVPGFVNHRLERLHNLVSVLRSECGVPEVVKNTESVAIRRAYETLQLKGGCHNDRTQDALMIMATLNWQPRKIPEYLPIRHYKTVSNIRDLCLKRLTEAELVVFIHQQTADDFEACLVITALLNAAQDSGELLW
jgi:hypothetical protein